MSFESELYDFIISDATIAPLLSDRLYPVDLDSPPAYPAATYFRVDRPVVLSHSGDSGLSNPRYQFDLYAETHEELVELTSAFRSVFSGKVLSLGPFSVKSIPAGDLEGIDEDLEHFRGTLEYIFWNRG